MTEITISNHLGALLTLVHLNPLNHLQATKEIPLQIGIGHFYLIVNSGLPCMCKLFSRSVQKGFSGWMDRHILWQQAWPLLGRFGPTLKSHNYVR